MHLPKALICVIVLLAGCGRTPAPIPPWNGKLTEKIPEPVRTALEQAQEFELLSLDPKHRDSDQPSEFMRRQIIGKTVVGGAQTRHKILAALDAGVRAEQPLVPGCFDPRHAIRVRYEGKTFYLVICFECTQVAVFVDDQPGRGFRTTGIPEPVFDKVLRSAGVPLAEKAMLQDELDHKPRPN